MSKRYVPRDGAPKSLRGAWVTATEAPGYTDSEIDDIRDRLDLPAASAPKAEWEGYAASLDVDTDGMTKEEIIDAVS